MGIIEAHQLTLPNSSFSSLPNVISFLFDSNSQSLALHHSDSSFSLYPSLSPLRLSCFPSPSTLIPSPTSSAAFLHLHHHSNPNPNSIFLTSSPFLGGTAILLCFFIFNPSRKAFVKLKVRSNHRNLRSDEKKGGGGGGIIFSVSHGVSVKLAGGSNVFTMYSVSNAKIWVFAVKLVGDFEEVKLMKCAVIDCVVPVFSMSVTFQHLILGEENGVRVFLLRPLVKGRVKKERGINCRRNLNGEMNNKDVNKLEGKKINGIDNVVCSSNSGGKNVGAEGASSVVSNGQVIAKIDKRSESVKLRTMKLRQDTRDCGACFVAFNSKESGSLISIKMPVKSLKAISINALSPDKFLLLDSDGDLHLMHLLNSAHESESPFHIKQLPQTMKVRKLAVLPVESQASFHQLAGSQTVWISDGQYTVHMIVMTDEDTSMSETDAKESEELLS